MTNRKNLVLCVAVVISFCLTGVIYASTANENTESKSTISESDGAENHKKVEARSYTIWQDIKKTHKIDEVQYIELDVPKLNQFLSGKLEGYTDKDLIEQMNKILANNLMNIQVGSTEPKILLNKNSKEIVFAYKESDGKNTLSIFRKTEKNSTLASKDAASDNLFEKIVDKNEGDPIPELK